MKNLAKLLAVGLATVSATTADLASTTQIASVNTGITSSGNSNSANNSLPSSDKIEGKSESSHSVDESIEALKQEYLKAVPNSSQIVRILQGLSKNYTDVKISHISVDKVYDETYTSYFMSRITTTREFAKVKIIVTGNYKGKEHTYPISFRARKKGNEIYIDEVYFSPSEENICNLLEDISYAKAVKTLQEKNIIPVETLTLKKQQCYKADNSHRNYPKTETHYIVEMEIENAQKVLYKFSAEAGLNRASGLFDYYGNVDYLKWDTSAAKVQNNPLFPTEYFKPDFDCKAAMFADQKTFVLNQEIPVKLFNFILKENPEYYHPKELKGKKYTVSDMKVKSIESKCNSYWDGSDSVIYELTGVLTTSNGLKFKADLSGYLLSEPKKVEGHFRKVIDYFKGKNDPFYNRFSAKKIDITLIK